MLPEPPGGYLEHDTAQQLFAEYVSAGDFDMPAPLPKRATRDSAADFIEKHLRSETLGDREVSRAGEIMRFYDLRERAPALATTLRRPVEDRDSWEIAASALAILGDLAAEQYAEHCLRYFQALGAHPDLQLRRLIDVFFHLPAAADPGPLQQLIEGRMNALASRVAAEDDDAMVEYYDLEDLLTDRLPSVLKAKARSEEILGTEDGNRRRQLMALRYLLLEKNAYLDLPAWGAMCLQRECNTAEPAEMGRFFNHSLDIIRSRAEKQGPLSEDDEKTLGKYVTRCVRAVEFYGGELSAIQSEYTVPLFRAQQLDLLHWDHAVTDTAASGQVLS